MKVKRMGLALALWGLLLGCGPGLGPEEPWIPAAEILGPLMPTVGVPKVLRVPSGPGEPLRVVSYNVHFAEDVEGIAEAILNHEALAKADVFLLQEIESYPSEGRSRTARLADRLGLLYAYVPARTEPGQGEEGTHGLAILSSLEITDLKVMVLPRAELPGATRRRIATSCYVGSGASRIQVIHVHLDTRLNLAERLLQLQPALREVAGRAIVGGDFNTNPYVWLGGGLPVLPASAGSRKDQADGLDQYMAEQGWQTPTRGLGVTQRAVVIDLPLDAIYIRGLSARGAAVVRSVQVSDHWPLYVDLADRP